MVKDVCILASPVFCLSLSLHAAVKSVKEFLTWRMCQISLIEIRFKLFHSHTWLTKGFCGYLKTSNWKCLSPGFDIVRFHTFDWKWERRTRLWHGARALSLLLPWVVKCNLVSLHLHWKLKCHKNLTFCFESLNTNCSTHQFPYNVPMWIDSKHLVPLVSQKVSWQSIFGNIEHGCWMCVWHVYHSPRFCHAPLLFLSPCYF